MYILVQAITSFLKSTGLSAADVLGQEELCDTLLRYHVLPYDLKSSMIVKKDSKAQTLEPYSYLLFNKDSSGVTVKDMQGHVAKVAKGDIPAGEATLHSVDRVLLSGMWGQIACLWPRNGTALVRGMVTSARPLHMPFLPFSCPFLPFMPFCSEIPTLMPFVSDQAMHTSVSSLHLCDPHTGSYRHIQAHTLSPEQQRPWCL